jgi:hypothetical protein
MKTTAYHWSHLNPLDNPEVTRVAIITDEGTPRLWQAYTAMEQVPPLPEYMTLMSRENAENLFTFKRMPRMSAGKKLALAAVLTWAMVAGMQVRMHLNKPAPFEPSSFIMTGPQLGLLYRNADEQAVVEIRSLDQNPLHMYGIREKNGEWSQITEYNGQKTRDCSTRGLRSLIAPCRGRFSLETQMLEDAYQALSGVEGRTSSFSRDGATSLRI